MTMTSLNGLKILITRPAHQAQELTHQIQHYGGLAITFPTVEITDIKNKKHILSTLKKLQEYNFVLFISPNAVFKTAESLHLICPSWPSKTKTIATGPGTVLALNHHHLPSDYCPEKNFSGAGLLELAPLQNIHEKKILILKGTGGRSYLASSLRARGAQVDSLNVYRRQLPPLDTRNIPHPEAIELIICTSATGLKNLVSLLLPYWQATLFKKQLLVVSPRIANRAKKLGFVKPPLISDNASNEAVLQTLFS